MKIPPEITFHCKGYVKDLALLADWFFDGFFVDWMVQDRINTAGRQVVQARWQVLIQKNLGMKIGVKKEQLEE